MWEDELRAIDRGEFPTVDVNGEVPLQADEVCYLSFPCRTPEGRLYVTNRSIQLDRVFGWANWPLEFILSCTQHEAGLVLLLSDRHDAARFSTGDQLRDSFVAALVNKLISAKATNQTRGRESPTDKNASRGRNSSGDASRNVEESTNGNGDSYGQIPPGAEDHVPDGRREPRSSWEVLGLKPGSSLDEIKAAYHTAAQMNHPDKVAGLAPEFRALAERRMKEINAAYEELKRK